MFWTRKGPTLEEHQALEAKVERLEREWLDMYEKLKRLYDRTRKRQEREDEPTGPQTLKEALRHRWNLGRTNASP